MAFATAIGITFSVAIDGILAENGKVCNVLKFGQTAPGLTTLAHKG